MNQTYPERPAMLAFRQRNHQQLLAPPPGPPASGTQVLAGREQSLAREAQEGVTPDGASWRCIYRDGGDHCFYFRAACELADREQAYGLGYRIYRAMGYTDEKEQRNLVLPCDAHPDSLAVLATDPRARAAGTVSLWFDRSDGLPCETLFPREVGSLRATGGRLVEAGRLAIHEDYRHSPILVARLLNLIFLYAVHAHACTHLVCTVNPRHVAFYLRKLRFRRLGHPRPCARVNGALAALLTLDLARYAQEVRKAHAQGEGAGVEREANFYQRFLDPGREREAAAFLARTQRPMSKEIAAYYGLDLGSGALGG